jgi:hypothetical protein
MNYSKLVGIYAIGYLILLAGLFSLIFTPPRMVGNRYGPGDDGWMFCLAVCI